jgi:hypothetical protein
MEKKICYKCKQEKDICEFEIKKSSKTGRRYECKSCRKEYTKKYWEKIKEKKDVLDKRKKYYNQNLDKIKEINKQYYNKNYDDLSKKKKEYNEKNKEKISEYLKIWRKNNIKKTNEYHNNRKKTDPLFKLSHIARCRIYSFMKIKNITKRNKTFEIIGCSPQELKEHIEKQFTEGMSWDKIGKYIHIDHIIPLSSAKTEEEVLKLCHYTNLQPLWAEDNLEKGSKFIILS